MRVIRSSAARTFASAEGCGGNTGSAAPTAIRGGAGGAEGGGAAAQPATASKPSEVKERIRPSLNFCFLSDGFGTLSRVMALSWLVQTAALAENSCTFVFR